VIDFTLTEEQRILQETAREYAQRDLAPRIDEIHSAEQGHCVEPWPILRDACAKGAELGFFSLLVPEEHGGGGGSCVDAALVLEELGAVDVAAAASYFGLSAALAQLVSRHGSAAQAARWLEPIRAGCPVLYSGALSEPDRAGSDLFFPAADARVGPQATATRVNEGWLLRGAKSAFVTNAGIADAYFVMARTRIDAPPAQSLSMFYVPRDTPGIATGVRTVLTGWRAAHHAEVVLDDVVVPAENLIGPENGAGLVFAGSPEIAIGLAAAFVGLARAAHELAVSYAGERVSWGVPIARHQAVALKLAEGALDVHAAKLLVWEAARAADVDPLLGASRAAGAKVFAVDAAIRNAQRAVEVLGAYGVTAEYRAARYLNDAWVGWSCDFTRDVLLLGAAAQLS
jgi:alkylation response protein AidB-like acyl-CoA dehydrogenase